MNIDVIKFNADGLVPAIAQDAGTGEVLMQAYMSRQSLEATVECGYAVYYSRSRQKLWKKGETSGNVQKIREIRYDCDGDSILLLIDQIGGIACHTGARSCFHNKLTTADAPIDYKIIFEVFKTVSDRKVNPVEGSYTNYLLDKGVEKICKKIGEEATETVIAAVANKHGELVGELSDLFYHTAVLMVKAGVQPEEIFNELAMREGRPPHPKYAKNK